tara:strand:- start:109 stop:858 length:750 start_codon:yes stop_codon:yes gene_type:complete
MPNPRMNAAKMKAEALKKAKANKMKSKMGSPNRKTGKVKPKSEPKAKPKAPSAGFSYKKIKTSNEFNPKFEKVSGEELKMASPAKKVVKGKIKLKSGTVIKSKENTKTGKYKEIIKKKGQKKIVNKGTESPMNMSGRSYDMKMAYDKKLTPKARLHYLENERHDAPGKMKGSPYHMGHKDSPMNKALVGNQKNLPEHLKKKIEAAPQMKGSPYHMSDELKYGGPVIDQMQTLSQKSAMKVLKHSKGSKI